MRINIRQVSGADVLAGAVNGSTMLAKLLAVTATEPSAPEPVFLDFGDIQVATSSFLRESIFAFRDLVRGRRSNFYPVVANANEAVRDELLELVRLRGDVLMMCSLRKDDTVVDAAPIGSLEPKQRMTFDLVRRRGETDASELMHEFGKSEGTTRTTAWNNRLSALASLGLVIEMSRGRAKRYKPLFEGA